MTLTTLRSFLRRITKSNSSTYTDEETLVDLNVAYGEVVLEILDNVRDFNFQGEVAKTDLKSTIGLSEGDNGYNGEYAFPCDLIKPIRVEVSYDGEKWNPCEVYDINENKRSEHDADETENVGSEVMPKVRFYRNSLIIRPTKDTTGDITDGIYIEYEKRQEGLSVGSDKPVGEENVHQLIAYKAALIYYINQPTERNDYRRKQAEKKIRELNKTIKKLYTHRMPREYKITTKITNYK